MAIPKFYGSIGWKLTKEIMTRKETADRRLSGVATGYGLKKKHIYVYMYIYTYSDCV
jgi:hypothetical protein